MQVTEEKELAKIYQNLFGTPEGQLVLADIARRGKVLEMCSTAEDIGRSNLAKEILNLVLYRHENEWSKANFFDIAKRIIKLRPVKKYKEIFKWLRR